MEKVVALLAVALTVSVDCTSKEFFQTGLLLNWTESMETCRQNFAELVTMQSEEEYQQFLSYIKLYEGVYWIGLQFNSININNTWEWVNGNPTTYSHWDVPPTGAGCGAFNSSSGGWFILNCSYRLMSVCQGIITVGGNDPGKKCVFPFYYEGYRYIGCTTVNNNNIPWCATTTDYPKDMKWGNCPFTDRMDSKELWCATVSSYDEDPKWGFCTTLDPTPPREISVDSVGDDSVSLSWGRPVGMDGFQYSFNITYSCSFWGHSGSTSAPSNSIVISNLRSGSEYVFNITTVQDTVSQSTPASISLYTKPSQPGEISVDFVGDDSVSLSWGSPVSMDGVQYSFNITYSCSFWGHNGSTIAPSNSIVISNLRSGSEYVFNITTVQDTGSQSTPASISLYTKPSQPGEISVDFVGDDSVSLSWGRPAGMDGVQYSFNITYSCSFWGHNGSTIAPSNSIVISNLRSGSEYVFNITTVQDTGSQSTPASISLYTKPSQPGEISVDFVGDDSVSLSWGSPVSMDGVQYSFNITYSCSFWGHNGSTIAPSNSIVISNLRSGSEYVFNITTVQDTGSQSTPASISLYTKPSQPGEISVDFVGDDSVSLSWGRPAGMDGVQYSFNITYSCSFWGHNGSTIAPSNSIVISNLRSGSEYVFNITTVQDTGSQSTPASISLYTNPTPPGEISVDFVGDDSVSLSWGSPAGMDGVQYSFNITYSCSFWGHNGSTIAPSNSIVISNLRSGSEYVFNITTVQDTGSQSTPASISLYTKPSQPGEISVDFVGDDSVSLSWGRPAGMDGVQYSFNITYSCSFWGHNGSTIAPSNSIVISNLRSGSEYVFNITTVQDTGSQSTPASISLYTKPSQPGEISVDFVGDDSVSLSWGSPVSMDGVQYSFNITYSCSFWGHNGSTIAPSNSIVFSNLRSGSEYVFNITTVQDTGSQSTPASISLYTKPKEKRFYLKFVCSSTEPSACEKEKQKVQQEFEARLAKQLKGLYWKLNWKEKEVKECIDGPEEDV
ncbi:receptor-type tyrosine-protein phosphatase eta-like isoform X2 [Acipenser ruthenus]|uniref:receptor-type tyrosine-protein phosphatase eta-like isoform X2 n=1 Tax=Acipenser ruthenus TaxID=7906 RepID=UPI002740BE6F|nr:receptor-type tyrosine-protein phosphatase eta-like isoform X2 [Acipenser ruthenus]